MTRIAFDGLEVELLAGECVLDALSRVGLDIPFACRSGVCHTCKLRAHSAPPEESQAGLHENARRQHHFLSCICYPQYDLVVSRIGEGHQHHPCRVIQKELRADTMILRTSRPDAFEYEAGQFVQVIRDDGLTRPYSLASTGDEKSLEFHIKRMQQGAMSTWVHDSLEVGASIDIRGPFGECFYVASKRDEPMLLIGNATGLAPLYGIARQAIAAGHANEIELYHAARQPAGLYYDRELRELERNAPQFRYIPIVRDGVAEGPGIVDDVEDVIARLYPDTLGRQIYLCGSPAFVASLKKRCFLSGARLDDIHSDPFIATKAYASEA